MTTRTELVPFRAALPARLIRPITGARWKAFPWWIAALGLVAAGTAYLVLSNPAYYEAFQFIRAGLGVTLTIALSAYAVALVLGLLAGLGRISENPLARNAATFYVEVIRGVPMLVLIFFIALVALPALIDGLHSLGLWLTAQGLSGPGQMLGRLDSRSVSMNVRAVAALSITYGAFLAEIFRGGIQSVDRGQMEAARSQGMTRAQAMRYIILPQAFRVMLPALGNDFISMLKDSSLVSVLAVRDITQVAKLYAGHSFRYTEAYTILAVLYLSMTMLLSALVRLLERKAGSHASR